MPFTVHDLLQDRPAPTTVRPETPILQTLQCMADHDFSQLPVVDEQGIPMGIVTGESILRASSNFGIPLDQLEVFDAIISANEFRREDALFDLLDNMRDSNAVLIVDGKRRLDGIITSYDTTNYFRQQAEDMMLVGDIEAMLKDYILLSLSLNNPEADETDLIQYMQEHTRSKRMPTMYSYIETFADDERWQLYGESLRIERETVKKLLHRVRVIRNGLAHFQGEITSEERDRLHYCADWLARHQPRVAALINAKIGSESTSEATTDPETFEVDASTVNEELDPNESRYAPLAIWLQNYSPEKDVVRLQFSQVEDIIDGKLPASAYKHRSWWANDSANHSQSQQWLEAGWRVGEIGMGNQTVRFVRIKERERKYIDFFSTLLNKFKDETSFPVKDGSPLGTNYQHLIWERYNGPKALIFVASFARGKRYRMELYIDTRNQTLNKQIFDKLIALKNHIEDGFEEGISWERLDSRRASRIAIYKGGSITNEAEDLAALQEWTIKTMPRFYQVLFAPARQALKEVTEE